MNDRVDLDSVGYYRRMQAAVEELLILRGDITREDVERTIAAMDARDYRRGSKVVARAWALCATRLQMGRLTW